jgi:hypothetical protein
MVNPQDLGARVAELEKKLAQLESVITFGKSTTVSIRAPTELRLTAPKVRIDGPGGVEIEPILRTSMLNPKVIQGVLAIDAGKINGMRITKVPPFILPF